MAYYNVLAPAYLSSGLYQQGDIAAISAAYFYGTMAGLFPIGYLLDHFPLRRVILTGILGSVSGIILLLMGSHFSTQWSARFICGFFGGTTCFIGGIRLIAQVYPKRFSYFMGIFLSAGMFGGMICQYPLLSIVKYFGLDGALRTVLGVSLVVLAFNFLFLRPSKEIDCKKENDDNKLPFFETLKIIVLNRRNWCDVFMVSLIDTPVSIIGTLWGIVFFTGFFGFSETESSFIVMALFLGLIVGLPVIGHLADKRNNHPSIIFLGSLMSLLIVTLVACLQESKPLWLIFILFFSLGFFSSCQTMGFTWITQGFRKELIGRNSAFNSMIFMGTNGLFKQLGAALLLTPSLFIGNGSFSNILLIIATSMLVATIYSCVRNIIFKNQINTVN
jgi:MFS family permease